MKKNNLSYTSLAYFISRSAFSGIACLALATLVRQDSWISIIIAFILGFIPLLIFLKIIDFKSDLTLFEKIDYLFPNTNFIIKLFLCLNVFILAIMNFWSLTNLITSQFLSKTPIFVIGFSFIIPIIYLISKNNKVIARVSLCLFYISILLFVLTALGLIGKFKIFELTPVLENNPLKGVIPYISYNVLPLFVMLIFPHKEIKKPLIYGYLISSISLLIVMIFILAVLGIELTLLFQYPEFHILKHTYQELISFRLENILAIQWILDIFIFTAVSLKFCNESFNIKKYYILPIITLILTSLLSINTTTYNTLIVYYFPFFISIILLIIPFIIWLKIKRSTKYTS